jgi:anaerobic magnesium-protoporphyrin IX monomethyl ester cyclase
MTDPSLGAPLCLLALASPLLEAGFEVKLVDNLTSPDFENVILRETADALCLGISILTGPMIGSAIRIAKKIRLNRPELPIIFGGWHPTLVPEQTLKPDFVDAFVRGQGELTLVELAHRLAEGLSLHGVRGLSFKDEDGIHHEPEKTGGKHQRSASTCISSRKCGCLCVCYWRPPTGLCQQRGLPLRL